MHWDADSSGSGISGGPKHFFIPSGRGNILISKHILTAGGLGGGGGVSKNLR